MPHSSPDQSNREPLGCGEIGNSHHGCATESSAATVWCHHASVNWNLWGKFAAPFSISAIKNSSSSEGSGPGVPNKVAVSNFTIIIYNM